LENQEILRKRLTGDVAHDLRTPLATLLSHVEAMVDGVWDPTTERLTSCHEEITRIIRLVSDLEKLAHYESDSLVLNKTEFRAQEFLESLMNTFETSFSQKNITPIIDCDDSTFLADRDKLSQVFINLISNSLKFTPPEGTISVEVRGTPRETRVSVSDTGLGIAPQDIQHVFERFYRADISRNRTTGGTGIGLTLVKTIVEAHKGSIEVSSEVNKGTVFNLVFPK
jgi:two-component system, OmpR family, sensor histidine kinase BaeS